MEEKLKELIYKTLNIDIDAMTDEEKDYPLLSKRFGVLPYQMLVFFTRLEKEMGVVIPDEAIGAGKFNAYNSIWSLVQGENELSEEGYEFGREKSTNSNH